MLGVRKQDNFDSKTMIFGVVTTDAIGNSQPALRNQDFGMMQADHETLNDCLFVAK